MFACLLKMNCPIDHNYQTWTEICNCYYYSISYSEARCNMKQGVIYTNLHLHPPNILSLDIALYSNNSKQQHLYFWCCFLLRFFCIKALNFIGLGPFAFCILTLDLVILWQAYVTCWHSIWCEVFILYTSIVKSSMQYLSDLKWPSESLHLLMHALVL